MFSRTKFQTYPKPFAAKTRGPRGQKNLRLAGLLDRQLPGALLLEEVLAGRKRAGGFLAGKGWGGGV